MSALSAAAQSYVKVERGDFQLTGSVSDAGEALLPKPDTKRPEPAGPSLWFKSREYEGSAVSEFNRLRNGLRTDNQRLGRLVLVRTNDSACDHRFPFCHEVVYVDVGATAAGSQIIPGFISSRQGGRQGLIIQGKIFQNSNLAFVVNGVTLRPGDEGRIFGSRYVENYHIDVFEDAVGCRRYLTGEDKTAHHDSIDVPMPPQNSYPKSANGITVGNLKVYDSFQLRTLMNNAATQLAAINPFSAGAITGAYGTIQGVTRDVSYVAAQLEAGGSPQVATTLNTPSALPAVQSTLSSGQCAPGSVASLGSGGAVTCTPVPLLSYPQGATAVCSSGTYAIINTAGGISCAPLGTTVAGAPLISPLPVTSTSTTVTQPTGPNSTVTTTAPGVTPMIPAAPAANPFSAPTNLSVSAADMLAEQVQLNAQLQMYQMLLSGAQSDQLLLKNSRAIANRAQTTIGFQISLAPPRQFRHAVAEVRVILVPDARELRGAGDITVVNLLPSQKTYNVAKITSHQNQFGAGVVVEQVSAGLTTGKSKDRLYLAKDTDTVALQYSNPNTVRALGNPLPEKIWEGMETAIKWQRLEECPASWDPDLDLQEQIRSARTVFGWQFRPVLGAEYVAAGPRQVFAQLALPEGIRDENYTPLVFVQTRWRQYDEKRQVVGPVYESSCTTQRLPDSAIVINPLKVHDVVWEDMGNGVLKVRGEGEFYQTGMGVLTAGTNLSPVTFDGGSIQFFAQAKDLLQNGKIQLLGESREPVAMAIPRHEDRACRIERAEMRAVPYPDGNSRVEMQVTYGSGYDDEHDHARPLALIGGDVYGLKEKPFVADHECVRASPETRCTYRFVAATDALKSAQTFLVRDIAWEGFEKRGAIRFAPSFASLATYTPNDSDAGSPADESAISISPQSATVAPGHQLQFKAKPPKNDEKGWKWKWTRSPEVGNISETTGLYTAPASFSGAQTVTITAKAMKGEMSKSVDATVNPQAWYAVTGANLRSALGQCYDADTNTYYVCGGPSRLAAYINGDSAGITLTPDNFNVLSDTSALIRLPALPGNTVKIRWDAAGSGYTTPDGLPVAWDLTIPKPDAKSGIAADPGTLYVGDSRIVTFTGQDFSDVLEVFFQGTPLLGSTPQKDLKKQLAVPVSELVTKTPGYKELTATTKPGKDGKPGKPIILSIQVNRR